MNAIKGAIGAVWSLVLREPVYTQALVVACIAMGSAFGLGWDGVQVAAVSSFSAALLSVLTRQAVTPLSEPEIPVGTSITVLTPPGQPDRTETVG